MIYATSLNYVIGSEGGLPWGYIKSDMDWFRKHTDNKVIVMGRKTWDSIGRKLPNRINVVVSSSDIQGPDLVISGDDPYELLDEIKSNFPDTDIVIIGGKTLYVQFVLLADQIHITTMQAEYPGDTVFDCRHLCNMTYKHIHHEHLPETDASPGIMFDSYEKLVH